MKRNRVEGQTTQMMNNKMMISEADPFTFARSYQLEALEKAMKENTIVFLETGSGKTLIAVMLIKNYAFHLRKPSPFISVFLVPTVVLVAQQAKVVETHTDLKVGKYWGEMGVDFWDAATWKKEFETYELFVMTPQILLDALRHSFLKIEMIKLLIFDECHNARGKSPYACIMTEFYHRELHSGATQLPRIFGMTASPIKSKAPALECVFGSQILELESLMNSKVYTVANESVLAQFIPFSTPKLKFYKGMDISPQICHLSHCLEGLKKKHLQSLKEWHLDDCSEVSLSKKISKICATFLYCITHLGVWLALKASETFSRTEIDNFPWLQGKNVIDNRIVKDFNRDVLQLFLSYIPSAGWTIGGNIAQNIDAGLLTPKVDRLIDSLLEYRNVKDLRCIIFVERVITAIVLQCLLSQLPQLSFWKMEYMAGNQSELHSQIRKKQIGIVESFRDGLVNVIVATQILEEGLDVQSCNLVIRFDPANTVCSFIQSRGRARMQGSDFLIFVEREDASTLSRVKKYLASGDIMREQSLLHASLPCAPLETEMLDEEFYRVESTGAIVTLSSSVSLVNFYCSRLPSDGYFRPAPRFSIDKDSECCTLRLPLSCPVQYVFARGEVKKLKKIACLEACRRLHEVGALTDNLLPKLAEEEANAQIVGNLSYEDEHDSYFPGELVSHPSFNFQEGLYFCYSIELKRNFEYDVPFNDIILLMRCDLELGSMNYDFNLEIDRGSVTVNILYHGTMRLNSEQVLTARRFQITLLKLLLQKDLYIAEDAVDSSHLESSHQMIDYLLLPCRSCHLESKIIDWECVRSACFRRTVQPAEVVQVHHKHPCTSKCSTCSLQTKNGVICSCILENSLVLTPHNGCIYCITGILHDLDANSLMKGAENAFTYKKYYQRHGIELQYDGEPLLIGRHTFTVKSRFQRHNHQKDKGQSNNFVELPPELCLVVMSPIAVGVVYSFSFIPSIMHRLESLLIAINLKKLQSDHFTHNVYVPPKKVLEAITTKKCLEEFSLESLETLGDSFLKYVTCQQLFRANEHHHEGLLSAQKDKMIANSFLCKLGCDHKLPGFIRTECFNSRLWRIPGDHSELDEVLLSDTRKIYSKGRRKIRSKVVADVVEALIGAYLSTGGESAALLFMDWLGMKVDLVNVPHERPFLAHPERHVNIRDIESLLKYSFREPSLLVEAFTHGSFMVSEIPKCYQRLEFLGDSVLDYLITKYFYAEYPNMFPGLLTDLRSASVNNECYARAVLKAGLYKYVLHASSMLHNQITSAVNNFEHSSSSSTFGWDSETDLPKVLGDIMESIAGAIFVDTGYNNIVVWEKIRPFLEPMVTPNTVKLHPVRELGELCSRRHYLIRKPEQLQSKEGAVSVTIEVEAEGSIYQETQYGANKKVAKKLAAKSLLESLKASIRSL